MKKKLLLLITLLLSLFIYSEKANAIVMWMQCTNDAEGTMPHNLEVSDKHQEYNMYNTFAIINNYHSYGTAIKHIIYVGGTDSKGRSKNFFEVNGPTFMMNASGHRDSAYDEKVCWFQKSGAGEGKLGKDSHGDDLTQCDEDDENINPYIDVSNLNDGICPVSIYQTTSNFGDWGTSGATVGNFVVMTGSQKAKSSNKEELNGYKLVLYQASVADDNKLWIIETYSDYGVYGVLFGFSYDTAGTYILNSPNSPKYIGWDSSDWTDELKAGHLDLIYQILFDIRLCGYDTFLDDMGEFNGILKYGDVQCRKGKGKEDYFYYDHKYIDFNQITQMIRLYYNGRNYFKLTEYNKYPEVLVANIGGFKDNNSKKYIIDSVHAYERGNDIWKESSEWKKIVGGSLGEQNEKFSKFLDGGEYYSIVTEANGVSESVSKGKKYELETDSDGKVKNIDNIINKLNLSYDDIEILLGEKFGYPTYKKSSVWESIFDMNNDSQSNNELGLCVQDGVTNDAAYSLADYVSCRTMGVPISYAAENYIGKNNSVVINTFELAMSDQIKKMTNYNSDLLNINGRLKEYVIDLSKYTSYISKNYGENLSESQKKELEEILNKYLDMARKEFQIEIVIDCDTLLGEDFLNKIEKYVNIIKIAIPIILIGFGIYDFVSAIFAGDEDKMKKAQKKFIMRIVISILFFLLPFIIKLILTIANRAWSFISPSSCNFM